MTLNGYDTGKVAKRYWGSNGYEYYLSLGKNDTSKLFEKLGVINKSDEEKLAIVKEKFDWSKGLSEFKKYCNENRIKTSFFSYVETDWDD